MTARPLTVTHWARVRLVAGECDGRTYEDPYCMAARRRSAQKPVAAVKPSGLLRIQREKA